MSLLKKRASYDNGVSIIGAGGLGKIVKNILELNHKPILGFYDDNYSKGKVVHGYPILGTLESLLESDVNESVSSSLIIAIGDIDTRRELFDKLTERGYYMISAIHPTASISNMDFIGEGTIIKDNATVEIGAVVGHNCVIGNNSVISHDSVIRSHTRLSPSVTLAGHVKIGKNCYICPNVSIDRDLEIGDNSVIASGCTIFEDIPKNSKVYLPNRMVIKTKED